MLDRVIDLQAYGILEGASIVGIMLKFISINRMLPCTQQSIYQPRPEYAHIPTGDLKLALL